MCTLCILVYLYTTGYFKRRVILKQQFTIEKGYYVNDSAKKYYSTPYLLSRMALRLLKIIEPYLVEQNRMANAQLLWYGSKHLEQNFFFKLNKKDIFVKPSNLLR